MTLLMSQFDAQLVARLLEAANARSEIGKQAPQAAEFDWKTPSRFRPDQLPRLEGFAKDLAEAVSTTLGGLLRVKTGVESQGLSQHYAVDLQARQSQADVYCVALADGDSRCGLVTLARSCALGWVGRLLGATSGGDQGRRELTSVETAILLDMLAALAGTFSQARQKAGGRKLASVSGLLNAQEIKDLIGQDATKEYCRIALRATEGAAEPILTFILTCDALEGVAGAEGTKAAPASADAVRKAVMYHLEQVPITLRVRLGEAQVSVGELMRLEPGDVVLLDKGADQPVELLVQERVVMSGFPVACEGQYALRIAARTGGTKK